jgi:hypothetical protein
MFAINDYRPFPSLWTLLPVTGTALLIFAGSMKSARTNSVLSSLKSRPLVAVGDYSYSIHLWHWPFIVFAFMLFPEVPGISFIAVIASIVPAVLSFRLVEKPLRGLIHWKASRIVGIILFAFIPLMLASIILIQNNRNASELTWQSTDDFFDELESNYFPCPPGIQDTVTLHYSDSLRCFQSKPSSNYDIAVLGDSHAEHLFPGVASELTSANVIYLISENPQISDANTREFIDFIDREGIRTVIYSAAWSYRFPELDTKSELAIKATVARIEASGSRVIIVGGTPSFDYEGSDCEFPAFIGPSRCQQAEIGEQKSYPS